MRQKSSRPCQHISTVCATPYCRSHPLARGALDRPLGAGICPGIPASVNAKCPRNFAALSGTEAVIGCYCEAAATTGPVWGTGVYTSDSSLCAAARHAGVIGPGGGTIWAQGAPGMANYPGTASNGVISANYGKYGTSFWFPLGPGAAVPGAGNACPANVTALRGRNGHTFSCHCSSRALASGAVWGSANYTDDSGLCRAALHAGAVSSSGGAVSITISPGRNSYHGSVRNGVTTRDYGRWHGSFVFSR